MEVEIQETIYVVYSSDGDVLYAFDNEDKAKKEVGKYDFYVPITLYR